MTLQMLMLRDSEFCPRSCLGCKYRCRGIENENDYADDNLYINATTRTNLDYYILYSKHKYNTADTATINRAIPKLRLSKPQDGILLVQRSCSIQKKKTPFFSLLFLSFRSFQLQLFNFHKFDLIEQIDQDIRFDDDYKKPSVREKKSINSHRPPAFYSPSSNPEANAWSICPCLAFPVRAITIFLFNAPAASDARISRMAVIPSITGISRSITTTSNSLLRFGPPRRCCR